jgi:hypothetical protein
MKRDIPGMVRATQLHPTGKGMRMDRPDEAVFATFERWLEGHDTLPESGAERLKAMTMAYVRVRRDSAVVQSALLEVLDEFARYVLETGLKAAEECRDIRRGELRTRTRLRTNRACACSQRGCIPRKCRHEAGHAADGAAARGVELGKNEMRAAFYVRYSEEG